MSDDYGSGNEADSFDQDNEQNIASSYGDDQENEENHSELGSNMSDKDNLDMEQEDIESVEEQQEQFRYEVKQQEQIVYDKPNEERITSPFMTKYEKARIIGVRAVQISKNSPLYLTADSSSLMNWDPLTIAEKELADKKIPFIIRRYLPDGSFQDWKISELKTFD